MEKRANFKINLFTTFYYDAVESRQREYDITIKENLANDLIETIVFLLEPGVSLPYVSDKIKTFDVPKRPTYQEFLTAMNELGSEDAYNILAATDIYFDDSIYLLDQIDFTNTALTLNRWEILNDKECQFFNKYYTSDTWIFKGIPKVFEATYYLGQPGCDNRFIYDLYNAGYTILNPSLSIMTWHLHSSQIRTWIHKPTKYKRVATPYLFTLPDFLNNDKSERLYPKKKRLYRQVRYDLNKAILKGKLGSDILVQNKPNRINAFFNCIYYFNYSRKNLGDIVFNRNEV